LTSDIGFFKCVDDSVKLLRQYSDQPVYYYHYAHKGQNNLAKIFNAPPELDFGELNRILKSYLSDDELPINFFTFVQVLPTAMSSC
jgi:hypothetical protein